MCQGRYEVEFLPLHGHSPFLHAEWVTEPAVHRRFLKDGLWHNVNGTLRSVRCHMQSSDGSPLPNGQCRECVALGKNRAFRAALERAKTPPGERARLGTLSRADLEKRVSKQASAIKDLTRKLVRRDEKADSAAESARLPAAMQRIVDGLALVTDGPGLCDDDLIPVLDVLYGAVSNMRAADPRGRRHKPHERSMKMYEVLLYKFGPSAMKFVAANLNGPQCETTVKAPLRSVPCYSSGLAGSRIVLPWVVQVYKEAMKTANLPPGQVPYELSEDETNTLDEIEYRQETDTLHNFCGRHGTCRQPRCRCPMEHHRCEDSFVVPVGAPSSGFGVIVGAFENFQRGCYARVIMINPLHKSLPKIAVFISSTCNRFDHAAVRFQWDVLDTLCEESGLHGVLGPQVGHASDGDARRRQLQLADMLPKTGGRCKPVECANFPLSGLSAATPGGPPSLVSHGQDFVHNGKKMVNPLDHQTKELQLGVHVVSIGHLLIVAAVFQLHEHKCAQRDLTRKDRQNWASAQALFKSPMLQCLRKLHYEKKVPCLGTLVYLRMVNRYISIFYSRTLSLQSRIKLASFVVHFLCRWRMWIVTSKSHSLSAHFVSREAYQDVLISCHQIILVVRLFRDHCPDVPVCFDELGSDCCESFFSSHGS